MKTYPIATLTINPALDKSTKFSGLIAEQKIRCESPSFDAGGGGINVSKAISRMGGESLCIFTAGGSSGLMLEKLVDQEKIEKLVIPVESYTRENLTAFDTQTNKQYRFGFPGSPLSEPEQTQIRETVKNLRCNYFVISGSLNEGLPTDFYSDLAISAKANGAKIIADTSGESLKMILKTGVYLAKPNVGELAKLVGVKKLDADEADDAARTLIDQNFAEIVVVSLGPQGAVLVSKDETHYIPAPNVEKKSTVGAGDSMVGGMVWALSQNKPLKEVVQWGVACGSAATMNDGTQLFKADDARKLFNWLQKR